ncbi:OLC1v1033765C1 [Oldenlandia corymbosa var. corymbosa]|uniref:OLC1v1033765C1 n=1 Tax=Oldenlandia corymbosa var. corymbosa TaxID=529605 RepID=A0AAV1CRY9_OLDCO|nr:OLC1v1033765C1 [Oldenlandia corymbosa var. corymbosa]
MFPLHLLTFSSSILLVYILVCWFTYFDLQSGSCYLDTALETHTCEDSQYNCGDSSHQNLRFPFQFDGDNSNPCRYPHFTFSCLHNRTVLYLDSFYTSEKQYYYVDVDSFNFQNRTIRVIDPGLQKGNCSSLPLYPIQHQYLYSAYSDGRNLWLGLRISDEAEDTVVFMSCGNPVKNSQSNSTFHRLIDTASCSASAWYFPTKSANTSHDYVMVGRNLVPYDIPESCTINKILPVQIRDEFLLSNKTADHDDVAFEHIHNLLADGFQLQWAWASGSGLSTPGFRLLFLSESTTKRRRNKKLFRLLNFSTFRTNYSAPMRLRRKSAANSASKSASFSLYSPPSSSSASSSSSITVNSLLASSIDSSSSSSADPPYLSSTSATSEKRCQGLDLLVKAIHLVTAGSVVGVPYIQRRVVQRRRRALKFNGFGFVVTQLSRQHQEEEGVKEELHIKTRSMLKRQSRMMGFP